MDGNLLLDISELRTVIMFLSVSSSLSVFEISFISLTIISLWLSYAGNGPFMAFIAMSTLCTWIGFRFLRIIWNFFVMFRCHTPWPFVS